MSAQQPFGQVQQKLLAYARAVAGGSAFFGHDDLAIMFVLESVPRLERLAALIAGLPFRARVHPLSLDDVRDASALAQRLAPASDVFRPVR